MNASEGTIDRCGLDGNNTERVLIDNYMTTSSRITLGKLLINKIKTLSVCIIVRCYHVQ